jgi:hypothetical protein
MASQIFIAHTESDRQTAALVCAALERGGMRGWLVFREVPIGVDTRTTALQAIETSAACVLILSSATDANSALLEQVNRVREWGLPLIALRLGSLLPPPALQEALQTSLSVDADPAPSEPQLEPLVKTVRAALLRSRTALEKPTLDIGSASSGLNAAPPASLGSEYDLPVKPDSPLPGASSAPPPVSPSYGSSASPPLSSGYGSAAPPPGSSGFGSSAPSQGSSGYGSSTPPPLPPGYGSSAPPPGSPAAPHPPYTPPAYGGMPYAAYSWQGPFRSVMALGWCVLVLLAFNLILDLVETAAGLGQAQLLSRMTAGGFNMAEVTSNDNRMQIIGVLQLVLLVWTAICLLIWMYRSYKNLPALGAQELTLSPGWAAGGFFVPFLNLVIPYMVMSEIWRARKVRPPGKDAVPPLWSDSGGLAGCLAVWPVGSPCILFGPQNWTPVRRK